MSHKYFTIVIVVVIFLLLAILFLIPKQLSSIPTFLSTGVTRLFTSNKSVVKNKSDSMFIKKESTDYTVKRPDWTVGEVPKITGENIIDTIAHTDNCTYMLINTAINISNDNVEEYLENIVNNKISSYFIKISKKMISSEQIYIEGDFKNAGNEFYAVGKGFFSKDRKRLYFMVFTGKPDKFEEFCRPYIDTTFNSFKLQE